MQTKKLLLAAAALIAAVFASCNKEEPTPTGDPSIKLDSTELSFAKEAGTATVALISNREWEVVKADKATWVTVTPATGKASSSAQTITIAVDENTGEERIAELTFSTGSATTKLKVVQAGAANKVYFNNFDKEAAVQTSSKWPYIYATDCWKNETGTGVANVRYITENNGASIRNNSNSTGSGVNNVFFGSSSRFCVKNIALNSGVVNYTVSFYGVRNVYGKSTGQGESIFDHEQFKLYVSGTGDKWVALDYVFEGGDPDAEWGQASATFTVPTGTTTLCIGVPTPSETSTYRIDDLKLVESATAGTAVDFTQGTEISEFKESPAVDPSKAEAKTVQEFINLADTDTYYKLTGIVSEYNSQYFNFYLTDATGTIYVYSVVDSCKTKYSSIIKDGGTITLVGKYDYYTKKSQHEVINAVILEFKEGKQQDPAKAESKTVTEFLALKDAITYYKLEGTISNFDSTHCSFDLTDATGTINVYSVEDTCKTKYASILQDGFKVTVSGKYKNYSGTEEMVNAVILGFEGSDYLSVNPKTASVAATAGTTEITVSSDQSWTVSSDNSEFTVSPASGSGNGTVTVTYTANAEFTTRTANIAFAVGGTTRATTVITQAAAQDPSATTVELTNDEIKDSFASCSLSAYSNWTITSQSGDWVGNVYCKNSLEYVQLRNCLGAHINTPLFTKEIEKIEFTMNTSTSNPQNRNIYAVPTDTDLTTTSKTDYYKATVIANAYGNVAVVTNTGNTYTLTMTSGVKQATLISYMESGSGALYINSIKVYLKNN